MSCVQYRYLDTTPHLTFIAFSVKIIRGSRYCQHFRLSVHHRHAWRIPWVRISGRSIFPTCCLCDFACLINPSRLFTVMPIDRCNTKFTAQIRAEGYKLLHFLVLQPPCLKKKTRCTITLGWIALRIWSGRPVFLNRRALASIIQGRERFSWNSSF